MGEIDFYHLDRAPERKRRRVERFYADCIRRQLYLNGTDRVHLCKASCCRLPFALSRQDVEEGIVRWDLGQPYLIDQREVLRRVPVLGDYDPTAYVQRRLWVSAPDGVEVPISLVTRAGVEPDGTHPGFLTAYGSYEHSHDPYFSIPRLSLLDRGVSFAVAHVRGGGEMGREWYEQGRLSHKRNTFTDFVAVARHLVDSGWVAADRLAASGGSAGGLLIGAAVNLAPDAFRVVHADVPFVDALTTILDPSLPLTVVEWEEWGNPLHDPEVYAYMRSYTPYENIVAADYPAVLATTSLNDTRVYFVEPAKWVAALRATVTNDPATRPILLRTEMVAGHGGRSGRYAAWEQTAWEWAFILDQLGATEPVGGSAPVDDAAPVG